jgi:type VI secretion system protein VasJ
MDTSTLGTTPISPESPGGSDVRYDPDFEALQAEIDKMTSPTAAGQVNWARVADLAAGILQTKSKDLTVAGYLAVALLMTRQIPGLDEGTALLRALLENFWETLYPPKKRMRGRAGAIAWWLDKSENALTRISPPPSPADLVTRLQANLQAMDSLLAEKMPDAPLLRSLQRRIEALPVARQDPAAPEPPAVAAEQASGGAPQAISAPSGAPQPASKPAPDMPTRRVWPVWRTPAGRRTRRCSACARSASLCSSRMPAIHCPTATAAWPDGRGSRRPHR